MPLAPLPAPRKADLRALRAGLPLMLADPDMPSPEEVELAGPLPVYEVPLKKLSRGGFLGKSVVVRQGAKYLLLGKQVEGREEEADGIATLSGTGKGGPQLRSLVEGHAAGAILEAIRMAEESKEVAQAPKATYHLRCLEIPALHFSAIWMFRNRHHRLIPLRGTDRDMTIAKPAPLQALLLRRLRQGPALRETTA